MDGSKVKGAISKGKVRETLKEKQYKFQLKMIL